MEKTKYTIIRYRENGDRLVLRDAQARWGNGCKLAKEKFWVDIREKKISSEWASSNIGVNYPENADCGISPP